MQPTLAGQPKRRTESAGTQLSAGIRGRLPVGVLTFLMTDIVASTQLWEASPTTAREAIARHNRVLVEQVEKNQGQVVEPGHKGDSLVAVFRQAIDAVACAVEIQRALRREAWPRGAALEVRVGVHTGDAKLRGGHYIGLPLHRCARLMAIAHGGQIVISSATEQLVADMLPEGVSLGDLGRHRLRDLSRLEHAFQVVHPDLAQQFPPLRSIDARFDNIPEQLTSFIGRRTELSGLRKAIKETRLVTLVGPGGVGKTRLAIELARGLADRWPDGVLWIDLTSIDDQAQTAEAVAAAMQLPGAGPAARRVNAWLADKQILLLLDNCEHLVSGCAEFCNECLQKCPGVTILATSREPLGVPGEARRPVAPLGDSDALSLFEQRGRLMAPDFEVTPANREIVSRICRKLDSLPLAIELAASRLGLMTEGEMLTQLDRQLSLTGPNRSSDPRHRTVAATIDWSYRLLTAVEAMLYRRLAVFRGGFNLEAAREVSGDDRVPDVLETLSALVEKSMVLAERLDDGTTRYRLLEHHAVYAAERLRQSDESNEFQRRHYEFFARVLARMAGDVLAPPRGESLDEGVARNKWKRRELSNLWAALEWARSNADDQGLDFAWMFNAGSGTYDAAWLLPWIRGLLAHFSRDRPVPSRHCPGEDSLFRANWEASRDSSLAGDFEGALVHAKRNVTLTRVEDSAAWRERRVLALDRLGGALLSLGRIDEARTAMAEALDVARSTGKSHLVLRSQTAFAGLAFAQEKYEEARRIYGEALQGARATSSFALVWGLLHLAAAELECRDVEGAEQKAKEALAIARELAGPYMIGSCLAVLLRSASSRGDHQRALRIAAAHERLSAVLGSQDEPYSREVMRRSVERSRAALGPMKSEEAWKQGLAIDVDQAIDYALERTWARQPAQSGPLSRREVEVARLVSNGMTNRDIADRLFLSERTVEGHMDRIRNKLALRSRSELAAWAISHGLGEAGS